MKGVFIMEIFDYERMDGIAMMVMANSSVSSLSRLVPMGEGRAIARSLTSASSSVEINDPGLFFMEDILVTTGENLNTDFFDRLEVWNARATPAHKPLNFEHDDSKIIGHIVSTQVVDEKYEAIDHDTDFDEVPDKFHILNGSVIYKVWSNETQQDLIDLTIEEIEAGEWYVSMECIFRGFDYVITTPDGDRIIVARTQDSAFLTKHLRQYGGTGTFTDKSTGAEYKLARLLKNITFSGKGLVRRPANPESDINPRKEKSSQDDKPLESLGYVSNEANSDSSSEAMELNTMTENEIKLLQDKLAAAEADNKALKTKLDEVSGQAVQAKVASLESDVQSKATELSQVKTQLTAAQEAVDALTKRAEAAESELVTVKAAQKRSDRLAVLTSKGASNEQAEALVAKFENLTDEQFASIVDTLAAAWKSSAMDDEEEAAVDDEDENDKKNKKGGKKTKTDASTVIDNATPVVEPNLDVPTVTASASEKIEKTAAYLKNFLKYTK